MLIMLYRLQLLIPTGILGGKLHINNKLKVKIRTIKNESKINYANKTIIYKEDFWSVAPFLLAPSLKKKNWSRH